MWCPLLLDMEGWTLPFTKHNIPGRSLSSMLTLVYGVAMLVRRLFCLLVDGKGGPPSPTCPPGSSLVPGKGGA